MTLALARPQVDPGFLMIEGIEIRNFRCFQSLSVGGVKRVNVIVGDSGSGKTALLEALFMTLAGTIEVSIRLKAQRGFDITYTGPLDRIEEAIWRDYFFNMDWTQADLD
jgi:AAA15 family ATPase/GTPase